MFLIVIGLLFAAYVQAYQIIRELAVIFCIAGASIGVIWLFTLGRKYAHIIIAENEGRELEKKIYKNKGCRGCFTGNRDFAKGNYPEIDEILGWRKIFSMVSTGDMITFGFPISIIIIWIILLIITYVYG